MGERLFTPAAVLHLLTQIDELNHLDIGITDTLDDKLQIQIGESIYIIDDANISEISVDESVVAEVEDLNMSAYSELSDSGEISIHENEPVTSGIIKELAKTLLVGGLVRLSAKLLK